MKSVLFATVFAAASILAVSANAQTTSQPRDTGNMAYPAPLPQGAVGTDSARRPADTGNMAYPASPGAIGTSTMPTRGADTNSSQYQTNLPQGQVGTTVTK